MLLIVTGAVTLSWPGQVTDHSWYGSLAIEGACLCWAIDKNLTRNISSSDSFFIVGSKGLVSRIVNISLAMAVGIALPQWSTINYDLLVGLLGYGVNVVHSVIALRGLGTARTGAYFQLRRL